MAGIGPKIYSKEMKREVLSNNHGKRQTFTAKEKKCSRSRHRKKIILAKFMTRKKNFDRVDKVSPLTTRQKLLKQSISRLDSAQIK